jgi:hypothetical protein
LREPLIAAAVAGQTSDVDFHWKLTHCFHLKLTHP